MVRLPLLFLHHSFKIQTSNLKIVRHGYISSLSSSKVHRELLKLASEFSRLSLVISFVFGFGSETKPSLLRASTLRRGAAPTRYRWTLSSRFRSFESLVSPFCTHLHTRAVTPLRTTHCIVFTGFYRVGVFRPTVGLNWK